MTENKKTRRYSAIPREDIRQIAAQVFAEVMQDFFCHFETIEYAVFHTQRETASFDGFKKISGLKALH